jgi:hypothetical protein
MIDAFRVDLLFVNVEQIMIIVTPLFFFSELDCIYYRLKDYSVGATFMIAE